MITRSAPAMSIGRTKLYELMNDGKIRFIVIGSVRRIPHAELLRFQEDHLLAA